MKDVMMNLQYMHYRSASKTHGGATIAITSPENNKVYITIAYCNPSDPFNKKVGRAIAAGRMHAAMVGKINFSEYVREIEVEDMNRIKDSVADALAMEMSADKLV